MNNHPDISFTDDFDPFKYDQEFLVVVIPREDVEDCAVGGIASQLLKLVDSPDAAKLWREKVIFAFQGWDDDPRALITIPEVTRYVQALDEIWPYWLFFCRPVAGEMDLIIYLILGLESVEENGQTFLLTPDADKIIGKVDLLQGQVHNLFNLCGLDELEYKKTMKKLQMVFDDMFRS